VRLRVDNGELEITGDEVARREALTRLRVSEPLAHAPRIVTFDDGAFCEIADNATFSQILAESGHQDSLVVKWQNRWRGAAFAVLALIAFLFVVYRWVLPAVAEYAAVRVPLSWEENLGQEATAFLEKRVFSTTQLSQERRDALTDRFKAIAPGDGRDYAIHFRASKIGPNALALPGGVIYVTDELVSLAPDDDAVIGVLAHELGHIEQRHLMRRAVPPVIKQVADHQHLDDHQPARLLDHRPEAVQQARADVIARERRARGDARSRHRAAGRSLQHASVALVQRARHRVGALAGKLEALSPLSTLHRGYAVPRDMDGRTLREVAEFAPGLAFELLLRDGAVRATVDDVHPAKPDGSR
jgi:hypothetical protein